MMPNIVLSGIKFIEEFNRIKLYAYHVKYLKYNDVMWWMYGIRLENEGKKLKKKSERVCACVWKM